MNGKFFVKNKNFVNISTILFDYLSVSFETFISFDKNDLISSLIVKFSKLILTLSFKGFSSYARTYVR